MEGIAIGGPSNIVARCVRLCGFVVGARGAGEEVIVWIIGFPWLVLGMSTGVLDLGERCGGEVARGNVRSIVAHCVDLCGFVVRARGAGEEVSFFPGVCCVLGV